MEEMKDCIDLTFALDGRCEASREVRSITGTNEPFFDTFGGKGCEVTFTIRRMIFLQRNLSFPNQTRIMSIPWDTVLRYITSYSTGYKTNENVAILQTKLGLVTFELSASIDPLAFNELLAGYIRY